MVASKTRSYCFTCNNPSDDIKMKLVSLSEDVSVKYIVYGREVGEQGTPHLQGFIHFVNRRTIAGVRALLPGCHISIKSTRSTFEEAIIYCKKDGDFDEFGTPPMDPKHKGVAEQERWSLALAAAKKGNFDDIPDDMYTRFYSTYRRIAKDYMVEASDAEDCCGIWIYGPAGVGKSRKARADYPGAYKKLLNKWWDGYADQDSVIIDDMDPAHSCLAYHLKIWADRYAFIAEIKGGAINIRPRVVCVTSQYSINECFEDDATRDAMKRRFTVVHMPSMFNCPSPNVFVNRAIRPRYDAGAHSHLSRDLFE